MGPKYLIWQKIPETFGETLTVRNTWEAAGSPGPEYQLWVSAELCAHHFWLGAGYTQMLGCPDEVMPRASARGLPTLSCGCPEDLFGHREPATLAHPPPSPEAGTDCVYVCCARVFVCCDVFTSDFSGPSVSVFVYPSLSPQMWRKLLFPMRAREISYCYIHALEVIEFPRLE